MLRICLIGPGDIELHYFNILKLDKEKFQRDLEEIARVLAERFEIVLLPDRGICFELAKLYKKFGGKKVVGTVPYSDKDFGIGHLKKFMEAEVNGKKLFDEFIDTTHWYKQDLTHCLFGDAILYLGESLGALGELVYGYYLYKLFVGAKPQVKVSLAKIHPAARAGTKIKYSTIVYKPFFAGKLSTELEYYIKKFGKLYYAENPKQLKLILNKLLKI